MNTLKITQITDDGRQKSWKLNPGRKILTFGSSRKAALVSIDEGTGSFESAIEYRNSQWHYMTFSAQNEVSDHVITDKSSIQFKDSILNFQKTERNLQILQNIHHAKSEGSEQKQLVLLLQNNSILNTFVLDTNKMLRLHLNGAAQKIMLPISNDWSTTEIGQYTLKSKVILRPANPEFFKNSKNISTSEKKEILFASGCTLMLILLSLVFQKANTLLPQLPVSKAPINIVLKPETRKNKRQNSQTQPMESVASQNAASAAQNQTASKLKNSVGIRISQLLGKVSSTEARTKNVLVTTRGNVAGTESSGRALAALGSVTASGRNWNNETNVAAGGVSTAGTQAGGGGRGLGGGLKQGNTGKGGVGLIEDESEIVGGLDREVIAQYIKTQLGQILYCYERQLSANPNLYGKIAVKFTITGSGLVETQAINDTTLKNISVESCILSKISKWKFPEPKGGTKVLVTYPFLFKSTI